MGLPVEAADVLFEALSPADFGGAKPFSLKENGWKPGRISSSHSCPEPL